MSSLGEQLTRYNEGAQNADSGLHRVNISVFAPSTFPSAMLSQDMFPFIDSLTLTDTSKIGSENLSAFEALRSLENLRINVCVYDNNTIQSVRNIILNNACNLKSLYVESERRIDNTLLVDCKSWPLSRLETLNCAFKDVMLFLQSPELCENLKDLTIRGEKNPREIPFCQHLPHLTRLEVNSAIEEKPNALFSFVTRLQRASPKLETLEFYGLPHLELFLPVITKVKSFRLTKLVDEFSVDWPMYNVTLSSPAVDYQTVPVNSILARIFPSRIRQFFVPLEPQELVSYALLKQIALGCDSSAGPTDNNNNNNNNADDGLAPSIFLNVTWPRIRQKSPPAPPGHPSEVLEVYEISSPTPHRPIAHTGALEYLSDMFLDFHAPFPLTAFCAFVRSSEELYNDYMRELPDRPVTEKIHMCVKIDLQRLKELLSSHAGS